jgi:hypothetical protein
LIGEFSSRNEKETTELDRLLIVRKVDLR